jgi:hypothetical protein
MFDQDLDQKINQTVKAAGDRLAAKVAIGSLAFLKTVGQAIGKPLDTLGPDDLLSWFNRSDR